ncbi:MAG: glycosyltransferase, partial [Rhodothermia bacterium]|nr:glycosyltransferase [Rhodothermia bacterium]
MKPRIAFITAQLDHVNSGPGTFAKYVRRYADECGLDVTYFSEDCAHDPQKGTIQVPLSNFDRSTSGQLSRYYRYDRTWKRYHAKTPFNLVWYNDAPHLGLFTSRLQRDVPLVLMINDYSNIVSRVPFSSRRDHGIRRSGIRSILYQFEKAALRSCDAVVANSDFLAQQVASTYMVESARLHVLNKAVDLSQFPFKDSAVLHNPLRLLFFKSDYRLGGLEDVFAALSNFPIATIVTVAGPDVSE